MPSFRSSRQSSRSQQQKQPPQQKQQPLREQSPGPGPGRSLGSSPDTGSPSTASLSATELPALDTPQHPSQQQHAQLLDERQQAPIQHPASLAPGGKSSSSAVSVTLDELQPQPPLHKTPLAARQSDQSYLDQVSRSQSQRYPLRAASVEADQHHRSSSPTAASVDSLSQSLRPSSPPADQPPRLPPKEQRYLQQAHQDLQQQPNPSSPQPPPLAQEPARTTRKLFKNFLGGSSREKRSISSGRSQSQQQQPPPLPPLSPSGPPAESRNAQSGNGGLMQRISKRISEQPTSTRSDSLQASASASDNACDWPLPTQHQQHQDPTTDSDNIRSSPLLERGEATGDGPDSFPSNRPPPPSIRRILTGELDQHGTSSYKPELSDEFRSSSHTDQRGGPESPSEQLLLQQAQQGYSGQGALESPQQPQPRQQKYPALHYHQQAASTKTPHHSFIGHLGATTDLRQHPPFGQVQQRSPKPQTRSQSLHEPSRAGAEKDQLAAQTLSSGGAYLPLPGQQSSPQDLTPSTILAANLEADQALQAPQRPQAAMSPQPSTGPPPGRRSQDMHDRADPASASASVYRHTQNASSGFAGSGQVSSLPPLPAGSSGTTGGPVQGYQRGAGDQRQYESNAVEGRHSPQLSITGDRGTPISDPEKALKELALKYKNVKRLYFDGKVLIDQLYGQIEHLQDTIASQRMSQSRTALDDSEYATRFNRLNGAINNMSFNIRKDWVALPSWIEPYTSAGALKTGKQEMTAVGRAIICRWVVESVFDGCFHPCLDPELSLQLKAIEHNIRHPSHKLNSQEESDALTDKITSWRMATLEGLQDVLTGPQSSENRAKFIQHAVSHLTSYLCGHLSDPPPPGLFGSASTIVELAVGIASNLPLESRDVVVSLPLPLDYVAPHLMEVEKAGLPSLDTRPADDGGEQDDDDGLSDNGPVGDDESNDQTRSSAAHTRNEMLTVRFAGFPAVEVRGRQVLTKASVWTM
ncbi:hypothetical protein SEPCBS119000_000625 [Sporothrix epigloea]|uniref:S-adenosylmethionine-dependent methyltransferase-like protein n=1 Tax=Sporothrix epigloea TaxID=1892477 RepID=A0ABP0D680_9PEZI